MRGSLTAGQRHDAPKVLPMLDGRASAYLIADRGYDADPLIAALAACGTQAVIPPRHIPSGPMTRPTMPSANCVERLFSQLKQFRCVATRYDKLDTHLIA